MSYKWKPSKTQKREFWENMQDPQYAKGYYDRKAAKKAKQNATSNFNYDSAGGYFVPTSHQFNFCINNMSLAIKNDALVYSGEMDELPGNISYRDAFNRVISGFSCKEKIHHDYIHIVNTIMRQNEI